MNDHWSRHPRSDEANKDGLWRHLNSGDHPSRSMPGYQSHYTKAVLVDIHRGLHNRPKKGAHK